MFAVVVVTSRCVDADAVLFPDAGRLAAAAVAVECSHGGEREEGDEVEELLGEVCFGRIDGRLLMLR